MALLIRPVLFVAFYFDTEPLYVNTTARNIDYDGKLWLGTGELGNISSADQTVTMEATSITATLSGVPLDKIIEAQNEKYRNRKGTVELGYLDENLQLSGTPLNVFSGKMNSMNIVASGGMASINVSITSPLERWSSARSLRYTNEMQTAIYPEDKGFEFVRLMKDVPLPWGIKK